MWTKDFDQLLDAEIYCDRMEAHGHYATIELHQVCSGTMYTVHVERES